MTMSQLSFGASSTTRTVRSTSSDSSTGSSVKCQDGKHSVFVLYAEKDTEWSEDNLISYLEANGISCFHEERDYPLGHHILEIIRRCVKHHPVTILIVSKAFSERYDDAMFTLLLGSNWYRDHLIVCVKIEEDCRVPKPLESITSLDFYKVADNETERERLKEKLLKAIIRRLRKAERQRQREFPYQAEDESVDTSHVVGQYNVQPVTQHLTISSEITHKSFELQGSLSKDRFASVDHLDEPIDVQYGAHVRSDLVQQQDDEIDKLGIKIKFEEGIASFVHHYAQGSPQNRRLAEQYILQKIIPKCHQNGDQLKDLACCKNSNIGIPALKAYRSFVVKNAIGQFFHHNINASATDISTGAESLLEAERALSSSLQEKQDRGQIDLTMEKIYTYTDALVGILIGRILGFYSKDVMPNNVRLTMKALNEKLHTLNQPNLTLFRKDEKLTLFDYNVGICLKALERIQQDGERLMGSILGNKFKAASVRLKFRSMGSKLELLAEGLRGVDLNDRKGREKASKLEGFDVYLLLQLLASKTLHSEGKSKMESLQHLQTFIGMVMRRPNKLSDRFVTAVTIIFSRLLEISGDEGFFKHVIKGDPNKIQIGFTQFWDHVFPTTSDKLKVLMKKFCKPLVHHHVQLVAEMAQRRTVHKIATSMRAFGKTEISMEDLNEINQNCVLEACQKVGLINLTEGGPVYKAQPSTPFWTWEAYLFSKRVKVKVCNTLKPSDSTRDMAYGVLGQESPLTAFDRELTIIRQLHSHDAIIDLVGFQRQPYPAFLITECFGEDVVDFLTEHLKREKFLSLYDLLHDICLPILEAVMYCHSKDVVLRDIMAKNCYISTKSSGRMQVKYGGFHLARELKEDGGKYGQWQQYEVIDKRDSSEVGNEVDSQSYLGTKNDQIPRRWSAPESVMEPYEYSRKSDVWMLACTLYEVLTHGCQPYTELYGMTSEEVIQQVLWGTRIKQPACIPEQLFAIILGCLMTRPDRRKTLQHLNDFIKEFSSQCRKLDPTEVPKTHPPPVRDRHQPAEPDRGIPEGIKYVRETSKTLNTKNTLPCEPGEIINSDQQSPPRGAFADFPKDKPLYLEEKLLRSLFPHGRSRDEMECLKHLTHLNICRVIDFDLRDDHIIQKSEFYDITNNLLSVALKRNVSVDGLITYLQQVTTAMAYLHSEEVGLIHCDLRASHVYIAPEGQVRLGRLGRACLLEVGIYDGGLKDSVKLRKMPEDQLRWAPWEVVKCGMYSQASDVFMFGQTAWEVFNAYSADNDVFQVEMLVPYPQTPKNEIPKALNRREHQLQPPGCPDWLYILMKKCWIDERCRRPSFPVIEQCLGDRSLDTIQPTVKDVAEVSQYSPEKRKLSVVDIFETIEQEDADLYDYYSFGNIEDQNNKDHIYYTQNSEIYNTYASRQKFRCVTRLPPGNAPLKMSVDQYYNANSSVVGKKGENMKGALRKKKNKPLLPKVITSMDLHTLEENEFSYYENPDQYQGMGSRSVSSPNIHTYDVGRSRYWFDEPESAFSKRNEIADSDVYDLPASDVPDDVEYAEIGDATFSASPSEDVETSSVRECLAGGKCGALYDSDAEGKKVHQENTEYSAPRSTPSVSKIAQSFNADKPLPATPDKDGGQAISGHIFKDVADSCGNEDAVYDDHGYIVPTDGHSEDQRWKTNDVTDDSDAEGKKAQQENTEYSAPRSTPSVSKIAQSFNEEKTLPASPDKDGGQAISGHISKDVADSCGNEDAVYDDQGYMVPSDGHSEDQRWKTDDDAGLTTIDDYANVSSEHTKNDEDVYIVMDTTSSEDPEQTNIIRDAIAGGYKFHESGDFEMESECTEASKVLSIENSPSECIAKVDTRFLETSQVDGCSTTGKLNTQLERERDISTQVQGKKNTDQSISGTNTPYTDDQYYDEASSTSTANAEAEPCVQTVSVHEKRDKDSVPGRIFEDGAKAAVVKEIKRDKSQIATSQKGDDKKPSDNNVPRGGGSPSRSRHAKFHFPIEEDGREIFL
ncbi:uncharacterized protein [Ptychodera flava]|uniref:uncharacterized protein n=1 Tax=Ptychodera flava TaxID=63121 RepID=UPI00396A464D